MKKALVVLVLIVVCFPLHTMFGGGSDGMPWSEVKQISWKDFKKDVGKSSKHKIHSAIGIIINPEQKDDQTMIAEVTAVFNKENSSKPDDDAQTDDALHHEQIRFDLAEVHARTERKQLPDSNYKTIGKFYIIAQRINKQANKDFIEESTKYDDETKNGTDKDAQKKWEKDINDRLGQLSGYTADDQVEIPIEKKITPVK